MDIELVVLVHFETNMCPYILYSWSVSMSKKMEGIFSWEMNPVVQLMIIGEFILHIFLRSHLPNVFYAHTSSQKAEKNF